MRATYLTIDFKEQINILEIIEFIDKIADYFNIRQHICFSCYPFNRNTKFDEKGKTLINKNCNNGKWTELSIFNDEDWHSIIDKMKLVKMSNEQSNLRIQLAETRLQIEKMLDEKQSLLEIIEKLGMQKFLLYMNNISYSMQSQYYISLINNSLSDIPTDVYKNFVLTILNNKAEQDFEIYSTEMKYYRIFDCSIDISNNSLSLMINHLIEKSEDEISYYLINCINEMQEIHKDMNAYLDSNRYNLMMCTPHEFLFSNYSNSKQSGELSIRGYTRYTWINLKQLKYLLELDKKNCIDYIKIQVGKNGAAIELENRNSSCYRKLKSFFYPLLKKGEIKIRDIDIFSSQQLLYSFVEIDEIQIIEESEYLFKGTDESSILNNFINKVNERSMKKLLQKVTIDGISGNEIFNNFDKDSKKIRRNIIISTK